MSLYFSRFFISTKGAKQSFLLIICLVGLTAHSQMMPVEEAKKTTVTEKAVPGKVIASQSTQAGIYDNYLSAESPYRAVILAVVTLILLLALKRYTSGLIKRNLENNAFYQENVNTFMGVWNKLWKFVIAILVIIALSGSLRVLGLTAGFLGMMLGWSLQQPVTGIAAWLMIVLKKPFKINDRVVIAGMTGDVTGITLTHVILNQVGGSICGEERSGRGILIPNAILFQNVIINFTLDQQYMLDEVPVRLTFDSDWERAKEILILAAKKATADIIAVTSQEPFIRAEFLDWCTLIRLRYQTIPARRQEISTVIVEELLRQFKKEYPRVRFAIPSSYVHYKQETPFDAISTEEVT